MSPDESAQAPVLGTLPPADRYERRGSPRERGGWKIPMLGDREAGWSGCRQSTYACYAILCTDNVAREMRAGYHVPGDSGEPPARIRKPKILLLTSQFWREILPERRSLPRRTTRRGNVMRQ